MAKAPSKIKLRAGLVRPYLEDLKPSYFKKISIVFIFMTVLQLGPQKAK